MKERKFGLLRNCLLVVTGIGGVVFGTINAYDAGYNGAIRKLEEARDDGRYLGNQATDPQLQKSFNLEVNAYQNAIDTLKGK